MSLDWGQLLAELRRSGLLIAAGNGAPTLGSLTSDSRAVLPGAVYVAVRGSQADGHRFVPDAVRRGAVALVVEAEVEGVALPQAVVRDGRRAAIALAAAWYDHPGRRLLIAASPAPTARRPRPALLRHLLNADGTAGSIGTIGAVDGAGRTSPRRQDR